MEDEFKEASKLWISGVIAVRDQKPYIQFSTEKGMMAQLSISAAQHVAMYILQIAASIKTDTMLLKFFNNSRVPRESAVNLMKEFREFRAELDMEEAERPEQKEEGWPCRQ
jgi:hypothetical protein